MGPVSISVEVQGNTDVNVSYDCIYCSKKFFITLFLPHSKITFLSIQRLFFKFDTALEGWTQCLTQQYN